MGKEDELTLRLRTKNQRRFSKDVKDGARDVRDFGKAADESSRKTKNLARAAKGIGSVGGMAAGGILAGGGAALYLGYQLTKDSVTAASDLGEQVSKTNVVFRGSEKDILRWAKTTDNAIGVSQRQALEAAGVFGNMLVPMGVARGEASGMSKRMVELAADLASFNNASPEGTLDALRAGLSGETEPLRRFGVFLSAARVEEEALAATHKKRKDSLTSAEKAQAAYALILKDTTDAQGDFERTSRSLPNRQRALKAQWEDLRATLGQGAIPELQKAAGAASDFLEVLQDVATREDIDLGDKLKLAESAGRKAFAPIVKDVATEIDRMNLDDELEDLIDRSAPALMDAMAAQVPRALGAFADAFAAAGPGGQLLTAAVIAKKLGVFGWAGKAAAGRFGLTFGPALGDEVMRGTRGQREKLRASGRIGGGIVGKAFVGSLVGLGIGALLTEVFDDELQSAAQGIANLVTGTSPEEIQKELDAARGRTDSTIQGWANDTGKSMDSTKPGGKLEPQKGAKKKRPIVVGKGEASDEDLRRMGRDPKDYEPRSPKAKGSSVDAGAGLGPRRAGLATSADIQRLADALATQPVQLVDRDGRLLAHVDRHARDRDARRRGRERR